MIENVQSFNCKNQIKKSRNFFFLLQSNQSNSQLILISGDNYESDHRIHCKQTVEAEQPTVNNRGRIKRAGQSLPVAFAPSLSPQPLDSSPLSVNFCTLAGSPPDSSTPLISLPEGHTSLRTVAPPGGLSPNQREAGLSSRQWGGGWKIYRLEGGTSRTVMRVIFGRLALLS